MKLISTNRALSAITLLSVAYFSFATVSTKTMAEETQAPAAQPAMPVQTVITEQNSSRLWKAFSGHLVAVDYVEIRPQASGLITKVNFIDGQFVNKGDVLYIIDPKPLQAIVAQKKANLHTAQNNFSLAEKELKRSTNLLAKKMISEQIYDESANKKLIASSAIKQAEAELLEATINLTYTSIEAPISGQINRTQLTEGNLVSAGANAPLLTSIVSQGNIYADFEIDEDTYVQYLQSSLLNGASLEETPVELRLQSSEQVYQGKIHAIDNRIDRSTGTIGIRAIFDNSNKTLIPGMFARIKLGSAAEHEQILITERAIGTDQNRKFVYVVNDEKLATYREVTLGESIKGHKVVTSGLNAGDEVIISGLMMIRPNSPVSPNNSPNND